MIIFSKSITLPKYANSGSFFTKHQIALFSTSMHVPTSHMKVTSYIVYVKL